MKLSRWAKQIGMSYRNAHRHYKMGLIPGAYQLATGTIVVPENEVKKKGEWTVVYARVSNSQNRANLDTQAERICQFCSAKGWVVNEIVKECASGLNDTRPKLLKIFQDRRASRIVVEHKDRLTRFGFNYITTLFNDCEIVVINEVSEDESDLMQDFVNLVTSFCARLYGKRRSKRATEKLIRGLQQ